MVQLQKPIGILGGTFDPIHFGHLRAALELLQDLHFEQIRFIPAKQPVHKHLCLASATQRLQMVNIALQHEQGLVSDDREIRRDSASYMVETLQSLRHDFPNNPLCLILGIDAFMGLHRWHNWQAIIQYSHIVIVNRPKFHLMIPQELTQFFQQHQVVEQEALQQRLAGTILMHEITYLEISATKIRKLFANHKSPRYLLPEAVIEYIEREGIYGDRE